MYGRALPTPSMAELETAINVCISMHSARAKP